jgi:hypothetical protein
LHELYDLSGEVETGAELHVDDVGWERNFGGLIVTDSYQKIVVLCQERGDTGDGGWRGVNELSWSSWRRDVDGRHRRVVYPKEVLQNHPQDRCQHATQQYPCNETSDAYVSDHIPTLLSLATICRKRSDIRAA